MKSGQRNAVRRHRNTALAYQAGFALLAVLGYICVAGTLKPIDFLNTTVIVVGSVAVVSILMNRLSPRIRRWPFLLAVLATSAVYTSIALVASALEIWIARSYERHQALSDPILTSSLIRDAGTPFFIRGFIVGFAAFLLTAFIHEVSRKLGPGVLKNWLMGRYRSPRIEERIFMFLDLKNSTALAEKVGDIEYSRFLQDFFSALTEPILNSGGVVSHYIGDEVVITWPLVKGLRDSACFRCFLDCKEQMERIRLQFLTSYGVVPDFKAALHCGDVVAAEVGDIKSEVVYQGGVLNTTARLQHFCRELSFDLIVSAALADQLKFDDEHAPVSLGAQALKGKDAPVEIVGLWKVDLVTQRPQHRT